MLLGLIVRSGIVVGAVYYTRKIGVWGTTEQTEKIYNNVKAELCPHVRAVTKQLPFEVPSLPTTNEVSYLFKHYYNNGVKSSFNFIHMLPCYTGQMMKKAKTTFEEFSSSPSTPSTTEQSAPVTVQSVSKK